MVDWEGISRKIVLPSSLVIAVVMVVLFCYAWWDLIVSDAVGKPLQAENFGLGLFSSLMVFVALFMDFTRCSIHSVVEAALGAGTLVLVFSCRILALYSGLQESASIVALLGVVGLMCAASMAVLVVLSIKQQPHCLRVGQNTEQPSLVEDAGSRNDIPSHEARNLTLEIRDHEAVDNERCCEPPPYSADRNDAEQPDCQPLLQ